MSIIANLVPDAQRPAPSPWQKENGMSSVDALERARIARRENQLAVWL
jgi:hypothetical protein